MSLLAVVDTSALIALQKLRRLDLLPKLYQHVYAPPAVIEEFSECPDWLHVQRPANLPLILALQKDLGRGESEVIALALELGTAEAVLDDLRARQTAEQFGIEVVGVLGLLLRSKRRGFIKHVKPLLDNLRDENFYISEVLYQRTLQLAGEADS